MRNCKPVYHYLGRIMRYRLPVPYLVIAMWMMLFGLVCNSIAQQQCQCEKFKDRDIRMFQYVLTGNRAAMQKLYDSVSTMNTPICKANILNFKSQLAFFDGKEDSARIYLDKEKQMLDEMQCGSATYIYNERQRGYFAFKKGDHESAVKHMLKVADLSQQIKDTARSITALMNVTSLLGMQGEYKRVLEILDKVEKIVSPTLHKEYYGNVTEAYANTYRVAYEKTNNMEYKQLYYVWVQKNIDYNRNNPAIVNRIRAYQNCALAAVWRKDSRQAILYLDSAELYNPSKWPPELRANQYSMKCGAYTVGKQYDLAKIYADSSLIIAYQSKHPESIAVAHQAIYKVNKTAGDYKNALTALENLKGLKDSIDNIERTTVVRSLELKYNKAKDEQTIHDLAQQQEISTLNIRFLVAALVGVGLLGVVLFVLYRQKALKQKQLILETEQRLNRARMNPHFFFNALTSLQTYSLKPGNSEKVPQYLSKYSKIMRHTLESTYNDLISLEEELEYLTEYLEIESLRTSNPFSYAIDVDTEIDITDTMIPPMILQPFIENSIEHGFSAIDYEGVIQVAFIIEGGHLVVSINDNGKSTQNEHHKGYPSRATQIITDRLFLLNQKHGTDAKFEVRDASASGYTVIVTLPILQAA